MDRIAILVFLALLNAALAQLPSVPGFNGRTCSDGSAATVQCRTAGDCGGGVCTYFPTFADGQYYCCMGVQSTNSVVSTLQWPTLLTGAVTGTGVTCPNGQVSTLSCDSNYQCLNTAFPSSCTYFPSLFNGQYYCCAVGTTAQLAASVINFPVNVMSDASSFQYQYQAPVPGSSGRTCSNGVAATTPCDQTRQCGAGMSCTNFPTFPDGQFYCCPSTGFVQQQTVALSPGIQSPTNFMYYSNYGYPNSNYNYYNYVWAGMPATQTAQFTTGDGAPGFNGRTCFNGRAPSIPCDGGRSCAAAPVPSVCSYFPTFATGQYYCCPTSRVRRSAKPIDYTLWVRNRVRKAVTQN